MDFSYAAQAVEVSVDADGNVKTERVVTVVDCGRVVSPGSVEAQVQGGTIFGLSAALFGNISIKDGRVEQSNFHDYRVLRMNEIPAMEIHVLPSTEDPTGIGDACHGANHASLAQRHSRSDGQAHPQVAHDAG